MPAETLISEATIYLFGRLMTDIKLVPGAVAAGTPTSAATALAAPNAELARIYAFSFQGEYVSLASPAMFVVNGKGTPVTPAVADTGLAIFPTTLAIPKDLLYWPHERDDVTVRLDIMAGTFGRVLLDYELADTGLQDFARGGSQLGTPTAVGRTRRPRGWRSNDE